jgi:NAD(P) transhydrogenase subunit alpha
VNVFGGFLVTRRMLEMFKKKVPKDKAEKEKAANSGSHA